MQLLFPNDRILPLHCEQRSAPTALLAPSTPASSLSFYRCKSQRGAGPRRLSTLCSVHVCWEDTGGQCWKGWCGSPSVTQGRVCASVWFQGSLARGLVGCRWYLQQPLPWDDQAKATPKASDNPHVPLPSPPLGVPLASPDTGAVPQACLAGRWHSLCSAVTTHEPN